MNTINAHKVGALMVVLEKHFDQAYCDGGKELVAEWVEAGREITLPDALENFRFTDYFIWSFWYGYTGYMTWYKELKDNNTLMSQSDLIERWERIVGELEAAYVEFCLFPIKEERT